MKTLQTQKVGSHNSMTYLKPSKWWLWPFRFAFKCQSLTLQEQLDSGLRIFDLRIRKKKGSDNRVDRGWVFAHGLAEFKGMDIFEALVLIAKYGKAKVRLMWEALNEDDEAEGKEFALLCSTVEGLFPNITFFGGTSIATWTNWYNFHPYGPKDDRWEFVTEQLVSSLASPGFWALWPWFYTTIFRKSLRKQAEESQAEVVTLDFIKKNELVSNN